MNQRLQQQINFVIEIDRLKGVLRQTLLMDNSRQENSAEHSLAPGHDGPHPWRNTPPPEWMWQRALHQVLIHDLVEIDAGDTFCYDQAAHQDKAEREQQAAERIFGLLPEPHNQKLRQLWDEFEAQANSHRSVRRRPRPASAPAATTGKPKVAPGRCTTSTATR